MANIVILGSGLTGLSCAYHLERSNFFDFIIFERDATHGGLCKSVTHDGFTFDYTGHLLHSNDKYFDSLLTTLLPEHERNKIIRNSCVFTHDRIVPYPFQMNLGGLPTEVITQCLCGFAKRSHQIDPDNFYDWVLKYFGSGIAKHFFFPYNSKLLQYDLKKIHPSWTGRFVPKTTIEDLLNGLSQEKTDVGYNNWFYYPKRGGIQTFTDNLRRQIKSKIHTNHKATQIDLKKKTIQFENGHVEQFDRLVTTIPLDTLLQIIKHPENLNLTKQQANLHCNTVINFNIGFTTLGFKTQKDVPAQFANKHWVYIPEKKYPFYRTGFWHNFSPHLAREGCGALYGELAYNPKQTSFAACKPLIEQAIEQTCDILKLARQDLVTEKILTIPHAYVIYDHWRERNLHKLHQILHKESVYSIGRYGEWKYSSMQEAILDGAQMARVLQNNILKHCKESSSEALASIL